MEAPSPLGDFNKITSEGSINEKNNENLINNTEFKISHNNKTILFIISMTSDKQYLYIKSKEEDNYIYFFETKMSLIDLIKFDKIFRTCDDIEDAFNSFIVIFKNEKNFIKEITDNKLIICINILNLDSSFREKKLELIKKSQNKDIIIDNLCQEIKELKTNKTNLLNELNKIKNENNTLKEDINNIKNWKNEIAQELTQIKEKMNVYEFKLFKIDSNIINETKDYDFIIERLKKVYTKYSNINIGLSLLYRATKDGDSASDFHSKCDKSKNTLTIVKTKKGLRFGGFTSATWEGSDIDKSDKNAFCFSLDKMKIYNCIQGKKAIFASPYCGPAFENCIFQINDKCFEEGGECSDDINNNFDNQEKQFEINNEEEKFQIEDVEVFNVTFS